MEKLESEWVMSYEQFNRQTRINRNFNRRPLQNPKEHIKAPENAKEIDLAPELTSSGCF